MSTDAVAPPTTVEEVAARLRALAASLPASDGVGVFAGVYLTVTEGILGHLRTGDLFTDPAATSELAVRFASRFFNALADPPPACWRPLLELRDHPHIHPLQFAIAGINAHVEHDLPLSVVDTCRALPTTPEALESDYQKINDVLAQVEAQVRDGLLPKSDEPNPADPLLHLLGTWSIDRARDAAWADTVALWELRGSTLAYDALAGSLDESVGVVCRLLLTPLG